MIQMFWDDIQSFFYYNKSVFFILITVEILLALKMISHTQLNLSDVKTVLILILLPCHVLYLILSVLISQAHTSIRLL